MSITAEPADIFLTKGRGFISRGIRWFSQSIGEQRTQVNHVGIVVTPGTIHTAEVVEALSYVQKHPLWQAYGPPRNDDVSIYRPLNLDAAEKEQIIRVAKAQVGRSYGYMKIITHFLDWLLLGSYVFRRLTQDPHYPICSWLVAHAYAAAGKHFGVAPGAAQPDDIWDFVTGHPQTYQCIRPLTPLESLVAEDPGDRRDSLSPEVPLQ